MVVYEVQSVLNMESSSFSPVTVTTCQAKRNEKLPRLVFCDVNNPMFGLYVVVPTTISDNRGLPHTLEHLIFTGSRDHPSRGYLDKLATVCLSTGTNAYTSEDHTCYFVSTASFEGLLKLLPVYLDHILHPRLLPEDMALEVFSLDPASKEARGVVYCEMKSREFTEADQMDIRLRNRTFAKASQEDPFLETYRWECGGATKRVSHLSPGEIRAYHQKFYQTENITIFVSGKIKEEDQAAVRSALSQFKFDVRQNDIDMAFVEGKLAEDELEPSGEFPANDESIGSVGFGWLGPASSDLKTVMALHILMRALRETTASPLFQEFVECPDPCASDIDYDVRGSKRCLVTLIFSGVPTGLSSEEDEDEEEEQESDEEGEDKTKEGLIKDRMFAVFDRLLANDAELEKIIQLTLKSFTIKIQEQYQEDPHELALGYCLPEILNGLPIGIAITKLPSILADLGIEGIHFWKQLFREFLMNQPCQEVIMRPSRELADSIKATETENLKVVEALDKYPKNGASLLEKFADASMPLVGFPRHDLANQRGIQIYDNVSIHKIVLPKTSFNTLTLGFNLKQAVEEKLWPYLVLYQELLFQCDIEMPMASDAIPAGLTTYQDLQRILSALFTNYEASVGLGNELFSASYLDSHLVMSCTCPASSPESNILSSMKLLLHILRHTKFTKERVAVAIDTLLSQLADSKRDPSTIIDAVFTEQTQGLISSPALSDSSEPKRRKSHDLLHVSSAINIFSQEPVLNRIKDIGVSDEDIACLNGITRAIIENLASEVSGLHAFVHIGIGSDTSIEDVQILSTWNEVLGTASQIKVDQAPFFPPSESLPRYPSVSDRCTVIPMADVTACFLGCSVSIPVLSMKEGLLESSSSSIEEYLAFAIFCHMLSFTEGPLYNRIRGKGLAYGAYLSLSLWNGLLSFDLNDSTAPTEAFATFNGLLKDVLMECDLITSGQTEDLNILCLTTLMAAKASLAYANVSDRSTPSNLFALSLRSALRGGYPAVNPSDYARFIAVLEEMSLEKVARTVRPYLEHFLAVEKRMTICVVPPSMVDPVMSEFSAAGMNPVIRNL